MKFTWPVRTVDWKEVWGRYKYALLVVLAGMVLLLVPGGEHSRSEQAAEKEAVDRFDLEAMEEKLEHALSRIRGAGEVTVVLTLKEGSRQVLARDTKVSDREQSSTAVVVSRGGGLEQTVPVQNIYPKFQGALVVCDGGGDAAVKLQLLEAVRALTGLNSEKISICKSQ